MTPGAPEAGLWIAVLTAAIADAGSAPADARVEARGWIFGPDLRGDFGWVCSAAGLEASWVRRIAARRLGLGGAEAVPPAGDHEDGGVGSHHERVEADRVDQTQKSGGADEGR